MEDSGRFDSHNTALYRPVQRPTVGVRRLTGAVMKRALLVRVLVGGGFSQRGRDRLLGGGGRTAWVAATGFPDDTVNGERGTDLCTTTVATPAQPRAPPVTVAVGPL